MTIQDLRAMLAQYDDDDEVFIATPAGDYWKTTLALNLEDDGQGFVKESSYHDCLQVCENENEENNEGSRSVVLLRTTKY